MAITAALVDSSPYMLKYLLTQDGVSSASPSADSTVVLSNTTNGATPNLGTDIAAACASYGAGSKLAQILQVRANGYGPIAAGAITQPQSRALLNSDDSGNVITVRNVATAEILLQPRTQVASAGVVGGQAGSAVQWLADATINASGAPTITVGTARRPPAVSTAYLILKLRNSLTE